MRCNNQYGNVDKRLNIYLNIKGQEYVKMSKVNNDLRSFKKRVRIFKNIYITCFIISLVKNKAKRKQTFN
jgi:hypothetical protein